MKDVTNAQYMGQMVVEGTCQPDSRASFYLRICPEADPTCVFAPDSQSECQMGPDSFAADLGILKAPIPIVKRGSVSELCLRCFDGVSSRSIATRFAPSLPSVALHLDGSDQQLIGGIWHARLSHPPSH